MGHFLRRAHGRAAARPQAGATVPGRPASPHSNNSPRVRYGTGHLGPSGYRIALFGAVAVVGLALHSGDPAQVIRQFGHRTGTQNATLAADSAGSMVAPQGGGGQIARAGQTSGSASQRKSAAASTFHQITLPDLLIVAPKGLTASQIARLRKIRGLRSMITFDGAEITAGGHQVSVIGVNPATFRSWVPLSTASDQAFWTALASGDFVAAETASKSLKLTAGATYNLVGASAQVVKFGMAARLDLAGVDLLVNQATSARLGLVHQVAGLISAPAVRLAALTRKVTRILGAGGRIEQLRGGQLPAGSVSPGTRPTTYIQLFKASAVRYCPGLSWTVLAAIGQIESGDGTNVGPSSAGALGPMQFLPSTWARWGIDAFGQTGPPNVMNPYDAVPSAARLLCADGAAAGGSSLSHAIFDYNHANWYVSEVLALAAEYAADYR
ncbi:MAG TPA: lytic transglycosylase domain-containing protein [Streptosporangiaceae bacterium]|nr:lytic transglycosylase domain-containing protein [Streptosporangiaceae bacterium]